MPVEASSLMDKLSALTKRRGFIFQSSEVYGGVNGAWDYGPLGVELKRNVKDAWWQAVVRGREDVVGLDSSILMHPMVWKASGHVSNFADPMVDCKKCKSATVSTKSSLSMKRQGRSRPSARTRSVGASSRRRASST